MLGFNGIFPNAVRESIWCARHVPARGPRVWLCLGRRVRVHGCSENFSKNLCFKITEDEVKYDYDKDDFDLGK